MGISGEIKRKPEKMSECKPNESLHNCMSVDNEAFQGSQSCKPSTRLKLSGYLNGGGT